MTCGPPPVRSSCVGHTTTPRTADLVARHLSYIVRPSPVTANTVQLTTQASHSQVIVHSTCLDRSNCDRLNVGRNRTLGRRVKKKACIAWGRCLHEATHDLRRFTLNLSSPHVIGGGWSHGVMTGRFVARFHEEDPPADASLTPARPTACPAARPPVRPHASTPARPHADRILQLPTADNAVSTIFFGTAGHIHRTRVQYKVISVRTSVRTPR